MPEILKKLRSCGIKDLEVEVEYDEYEWLDWTERVRFTYHSNQIDKYYTETWNSENCKKIVPILAELRKYEKCCTGYYPYDVQGKKVTIYFECRYKGCVNVFSDDYMYTYNVSNSSGNFSCSFSINGNLLYGNVINKDSNSVPKKDEKQDGIKDKIKDNGINQADVYDVYDYDDPAEFYYDRQDVFDCYEEAEDYWNEAWEE